MRQDNAREGQGWTNLDLLVVTIQCTRKVHTEMNICEIFGQVFEQIFGQVFDQKYSFTVLPGTEHARKSKKTYEAQRKIKNNLEIQTKSKKDLGT